MLKLYKRKSRVLHYHEAWADGSRITEHWGKVGERGETAEHKKSKKLKEEDNLKQVLTKPLSESYSPIDVDDHAVLLIEYAVDGFGSAEDLDKRHALEERMNELLGWTSLGECDGGSIGSGTMEVCCFVVDFKIAKRVIAKNLKGTPFSDYTRIYEEGADADSLSATATQPPEHSAGPLVPPWIVHQVLGRDDDGWQSGEPAASLTKFTTWYQSLNKEARTVIATVFREPPGWSGFYQAIAKSE